jgi:hypothetical protein
MANTIDTIKKEESKAPVTFRSDFSVPVNEEDPWHGDRLNRKESAALLTKLLNNAETPFTLVVNSPWGTGKSFFIERWNASIKKEHYSFYFSAWEAELNPLPILAFVNDFREAIKSDSELYSKVNDLLDEFFVKILILAIAIPVLLKIGAAKAVELAQGSSLLQGILSLGGEKIQEKYNAALQEKTPTIKEARKSFQELIEKIQSESSKKAPIYIFIDELDRCRPDFAIRFLEEIKHLFSVPGIVFVLSLDLQQLNTSIKHIYGADIEFSGYLRRFINQFYNLPPIPRENFAEKLFEKINIKSYESVIDRENISSLATKFWRLSDAFEASLRDMEAVFSRFMALISTAKEDSVFPIAALYLMFISTLAPIQWKKGVIDGKSSEISPATLHVNGVTRELVFEKEPDFFHEIVMASKGKSLPNLDDMNRTSIPMKGSPTLSQPEVVSQRLQEHFSAIKYQIELVELSATAFGA